MRINSKPVWFAAGLVAAVAVILLAIHSYRHRFVREDHDILALLPTGDVTTFFVDVSALRSAGMLQVISGSTPAGDAEYKQFVRETHFDYTKDLDALAGTSSGQQISLVVRGRFDWSSLRQYVNAHGGSCHRDVCRTAASKPGRWLSFLPIQPDVMGVALSEDDLAVEQLRPEHRQALTPLPSNQPVWLQMSQSLLKNPLNLPAAARIFAVSLQSAQRVLFSIGRAPEHSKAVFDIELDAQCPNPATAESTRNQMEIQTKMLNLELAREHAKPSAADLTGLLTAGAFQVIGDRVVGTWPVRRELLNTLQ